jgi:hypothetical protein
MMLQRALAHAALLKRSFPRLGRKNKRAALQSRPGFEEWIIWDIIGKHFSIPVRTRHSIQSLTAGHLSKLSKGKLLHSRSTNARHRSEAFPSIGSGAFTRLMMLEDQWTTVNYSNITVIKQFTSICHSFHSSIYFEFTSKPESHGSLWHADIRKFCWSPLQPETKEPCQKQLTQ